MAGVAPGDHEREDGGMHRSRFELGPVMLAIEVDEFIAVDRLHGALPRLQWFVEDADDRRAGMKSKTTADGPAAQTGALQQRRRPDRAGGRHHRTTADDQGPGRHACLTYGCPHANRAAIFDED